MVRALPLFVALAATCIVCGCSSPQDGATDVGTDASQTGDSDVHAFQDTTSSSSDASQQDPDTQGGDVFDFSSRCDPDPAVEAQPMPELVEPTVPHGADDEDLIEEHMGMLALVPYDAATHVAVRDGFWCNPSTWHNGEVPGEDARVVIMEDTHVIYDMVSEESIFSIRVDGTMEFATDVSSTVVFDTMVVDQRGTLIIGTTDDPVDADVEVRLVVADNGQIDVEWDPMLMSRGLLSHGEAQIHGQPKTTHLKVDDDPLAGDTQLHLADVPHHWQQGDEIVLAGTHYSGWKWDNDIEDVVYHGTQDEVLTIESIEGTQILVDPPLEYDHTTPRDDLKASVANLSRNVIFETQNVDELPPAERGHVMFMHSDAIDVRYAEFKHLGRTDKSTPAVAIESLDSDDVDPDTNIQGRYSMHFHRTGIDNLDEPARAIGNTVIDAPGWGFVHHDSHALFEDNASFDTFGAGFVAETGNETGSWTNNIAIKAEGNRSFNPKNGVDRERFDMARTGAGFWFQGRMVRAVDNIAASVNHGHVYFHRGDGMLRFDAQYFTLPEALGLNPATRANHPPILVFHGNEAFASTVGLFVVKANPNQNHDVRSIMKDFRAWNVTAGADLEYTSHYTLLDFDLIGQPEEPFRSAGTGINFGNNTSDMVINRADIHNFDTGIELGKSFTDETISPEVNQYVVIDAEFTDVEQDYAQLDPSIDEVLSAQDLEPDRFEVSIDDLDSLHYCSTYTDGCRETPFTGDKTDSIGDVSIPSGTDSMGVRNQSEMVRLLEQKGYYRDSDDTDYVIVETFFSDRATGEIHLVTIPIELDDDVPLHSEYHSYEHALENGAIDFDHPAPVATDLSVSTDINTEVAIEPLSNDSHPTGDELRISHIVQPTYGQLIRRPDDTVVYRPDRQFTGQDRFKYWAADNQGNFTAAEVAIDVAP